MGGFGSGSWQSGRPTTSDCRALDIRELRRQGMLTPGRAAGWQWIRDGETVASIGIRAGAHRLTLTYTRQHKGEWQPMEYAVAVDWTPCHFGKGRKWFLCPHCGRRVGVLYLGSAGMFACRHCYRLAYACQRETESDRASRRADNLRRRLEWEPGFLNGEGDKPKGMHWRTFERLTAEHDRYVSISLAWAMKRFGLTMP